jgi:hypothetical protein
VVSINKNAVQPDTRDMRAATKVRRTPAYQLRAKDTRRIIASCREGKGAKARKAERMGNGRRTEEIKGRKSRKIKTRRGGTKFMGAEQLQWREQRHKSSRSKNQTSAVSTSETDSFASPPSVIWTAPWKAVSKLDLISRNPWPLSTQKTKPPLLF